MCLFAVFCDSVVAEVLRELNWRFEFVYKYMFVDFFICFVLFLQKFLGE